MVFGKRLTIRVLPDHEEALKRVQERVGVGGESEAIRFCINLAGTVIAKKSGASGTFLRTARERTLSQRDARWG